MAVSPPTSSLYNRRALQVPFFPVESPTPSSLPEDPSSSSSITSSSSSSTAPPFFPTLASPPPPALPSSADQPRFPANVSSLTNPDSGPAGHHGRSSLLFPAVVLPLLALALLVAGTAFFLHRRRRRLHHSSEKDNSRSDSHSLVPLGSAHSDGRIRKQRSLSASAAAAVPDFLYLGTLVNSRSVRDDDGRGSATDSASGSPYQRLESPELRPLPPLAGRVWRGDGNGDGGGSSSEDFYSPKESPEERESAQGVGGEGRSRPRVTFPPVSAEKSRSRSSTLSTPSYPSSHSISPAARSLPSPSPSPPRGESSPASSSLKSFNSRSDRSKAGDLELAQSPPHPPPPPPPPLVSLRRLTPSPTKQKPYSPLPHSPSPHSSPAEKEPHHPTTRTLDSSQYNSICNSASNTFVVSPLVKPPPVQTSRRPPPPPPPPPPPASYWESQVRKASVILTANPTGQENSPALITPVSVPENSESASEKSEETPRPKLKPLHWDKVQASSDRAMVWDQLKSSSFQVNEEMIETLFISSATNAAPTETKRRQVLPSPTTENRVLDPKKSQNIAILLRALNVTKEEVCEALSEGNAESLGTELLETLLKMAPTKEEERKLKECEDDSPTKLGPAEKFLKALFDIPFAFKRVDALLYVANFNSEVKYLMKSFETLEAACEELRNSRLFLKLLEAVLKTGNRMNVGTNRGDAHAFKLDTLLKLVDVKGTDGKTTLLHFVVQEIIRIEGSRLYTCDPPAARTQANTLRDDLECKKLGLQVVAGLGNELSNVKKAAAIDFDVLSSYVSKLAGGVRKINEVIGLNQASTLSENNRRFHDAMDGFLKRAEDEIIRLQAQESVALSLVKEITEYFHGDSAREEAHPFRIFMVVRDFLAVLDRVCKEVGRIHLRTTIVSSERHFPAPVNPTLPNAFLRFPVFRPESSDDESSLSS